jgi:phosphoglycolate phosphatase
MKFREIVIFSGATFQVPQCIQRIDHRATHGWQLRYGGTKLFSDHSADGSGAAQALEKATKELLKRIAVLPAPSLQAAIVDLDGTMVDTVGDFDRGPWRCALALADLGPPVGARLHRAHRGQGQRAPARRARWPKWGRAGSVPVRRRLGALPAPLPGHQRPALGRLPGVPRACSALRAAGLRLACLTNKPNAFARPLLAQKGLDGFFEHAFGGDAFARKKPDPLPLLETCKALGTQPGAHADGGRLAATTRTGRPRRRLPGGAGELRLQPRRAGDQRRCPTPWSTAWPSCRRCWPAAR